VGINGTEDPFHLSLANRTSVYNESKEAFYLEQHVLTSLSEIGLMRYEFDCRATFLIGQPAGVMIKNSSTQNKKWLRAVTQDLLLPYDIEQVIEEYRKFLGSENQMGKCSQSRACHSIGRLVGYMVGNMSRYGILISGTNFPAIIDNCF
jgi:hypothetical protein